MSIQPQWSYYRSLAPFRSYFETGVPALMYHKIGDAPRAAKLKMLYVSKRVFSAQMRELKAAGFESASIDCSLTANENSARKIVITFDDGFENVFRDALGTLTECGFSSIQFLVSDMLGRRNEWDISANGEVPERLMDESQVREWLAAGQQIGAHTKSHPNLKRISPEQAREEIFGSKKSLEDRFGIPITHFCYPYGAWNERVRDLVAEAGFETACTTAPGVNVAETPRFELTRWTARHLSRKPRDVARYFFGKFCVR